MTTTEGSAVAARFVGARLPRREDARLVTGRGQYVDDVVEPRALHAAFVRCPYPHARIADLDRAKAAGMPGVRAVLTLADLLPDLSSDLPVAPLAGSVARYVGDPVAIVVADSRADAED